jgi:hypothetical protein
VSLCILAGGKTAMMAVSAFTLAWTHSVEKTQWQEDWRIVPAGLEIVEARIKGSGAGMEPPEGSILKDGWWIYVPSLPALPRLVLASSGATVSGWSICAEGDCVSVGDEAGATIVLEPCADAHQR